MNKCIVCDKPTEWFEPRFCYYACKEHRDIPPAYIQEVTDLWHITKERNQKTQDQDA